MADKYAVIANGNYVIVSESNPGFAIDVPGGSTEAGKAVQLWERIDSNAQMWWIKLAGTEGDYYIHNFFSDKYLDRPNNNSSENGTIVQQWDFNSADEQNQAQKWKFVDTGRTATVDNKTLHVYTIRHNLNNSCIDVFNNEMKNGTKIEMWEILADHPNQGWILVPQSYVVGGESGNGTGSSAAQPGVSDIPAVDGNVYEIHPEYSEDLCVDVDGASTANGGNVFLWPRLDQNNQKWLVCKDHDGDKRFQNIRNINSGLYMNVSNGELNGNVQQWNYRTTEARVNSQWTTSPYERTMSVDGRSYEVFEVIPGCQTEQRLDSTGSGTTQGTNLRIWEKNNSNAQGFAFVSTSILDSSMPVVSMIEVSAGGQRGTEIMVPDDTDTVDVSWISISGYNNYEVRYRYSYDGITSDWYSWSDNSTANQGWGNVGESNVTSLTTTDDGRQVPSHESFGGIKLPKPVSETANGYYDLRIEVRTFDNRHQWTPYNGILDCDGNLLTSSYIVPAHGGSVTSHHRIYRQVSITVQGAAYGRDGIIIGYTIDGAAPLNNSISIGCDGLFRRHAFGNLERVGIVTIPYSHLQRVPADSETLTLRYTLTTQVGDMAEQTATTTIAFGKNNPAGLFPSQDDGMLDVPTSSDTALWLIVHRGHGDMLVKAAGTKLAVPFGVTTRYLSASGTTLANASSGVSETTPVNTNYYWLTTLDGSIALKVHVNEGGAPEFKPTYERVSTAVTTTGREREVVGFGNTVKASWNLTGVLYSDNPVEQQKQREDFDKIAHSTYVVFRDPRGFWAQCAVISASLDYSPAYYDAVDISLQEVSL